MQVGVGGGSDAQRGFQLSGTSSLGWASVSLPENPCEASGRPSQHNNHNEHWTSTVKSLNLRGISLAGMAVFIAYFSIRISKTPLPEWFPLNPFLSAASFAVVVSRVHMLGTFEEQMAEWWDKTIENAPQWCRYLDYSLEGPWMFLLIAMPFACISPAAFGIAYGLWAALETLYMRIGRLALLSSVSSVQHTDTIASVRTYYRVRTQHEATASALAFSFSGIAILNSYVQSAWTAGAAWCVVLYLLVHVNFVEVYRNPWFHLDLAHTDAAPALEEVASVQEPQMGGT